MSKACLKALQCPGWPLCGVMILAVCFLASEGSGALSQGSLLSVSSLPTEVLGGSTTPLCGMVCGALALAFYLGGESLHTRPLA